MLELKTCIVPGWDKLKSTANDMWGDYQREIKTNNPDVSKCLSQYISVLTLEQFADRPARVCVTNNQVDITINGMPERSEVDNGY